MRICLGCEKHLKQLKKKKKSGGSGCCGGWHYSPKHGFTQDHPAPDTEKIAPLSGAGSTLSFRATRDLARIYRTI